VSDRPSPIGRIILALAILAALIVAAIIGSAFLTAGRTIFGLLSENRKLKQAISNLTAEGEIGYAKVVSQSQRDGKTITHVLFVETDRDDPARHILEKEYPIEGDIVHFDALVVRFPDDYVMDGKGRALYLWRRVYGETMKPADGFPIEEAGAEPARYAPLFEQLPLRDRTLFWSEIWQLANDLNRLRAAGVQGVYGNALYTKLQPGMLYLFKFRNTGQLYLETVKAP
jgi:hypothetical protein